MLLLVCVAMIALSAVGAGLMGRILLRRGCAQTAADAAALAGTTAGRPAAAKMAIANGARLVSLTTSADDVVVVVECGGIRATARASDGP